MFVPDEALELGSMLQGDLLSDVHYLGAINLASINVHTPVTGGESQGWTVSKPPITGPAMVLSHSCEISRANGIKVTSVILAPLRDLNKATAPDQIQLLRNSNRIDRADPDASFLKYFCLEPHPALPFPEGSVVDFSKCFSVRKQSYDFLLQRKVAQLTDDLRGSMALKLALYFHREQEPGTAA